MKLKGPHHESAIQLVIKYSFSVHFIVISLIDLTISITRRKPIATLETRSWDNPDDVQTPDKTHAASIKLGAVTLTKANAQPGWKWSECIKPHVGTESCQAGHIGVLLQGKIHVVSDDGSEITINAGEAYRLAPGHDAWVVGDEPAVNLEFSTDSKEFAAWTRGES